MGTSSTSEHELRVLWDEVMYSDPKILDLQGCARGVDGTRRLAAAVSAKQAELTLEYERLLRAAAPTDPGADPSTDGDQPADAEPSAGQPKGKPAAPRESAKERSKRILRAKWLARCERFAVALRASVIVEAHADVLAAILEHTEATVVNDVLGDEAGLVLLAQACTSDQFAYELRRVVDRVRADGGVRLFERQQRDSRAWKIAGDSNGMYCFGMMLDPERGALVEDAIRQRMQTLYQTEGATTGMSEGQVRAQASVELICGTAVVHPELLIVTDQHTAESGAHLASHCETIDGVPLPGHMAHDACATAKVTVAITNANGRVVASGCAERTATREQRRLLRAMYRTCAHPDCSVPFTDCQVHHVKHWEHRGPTVIANLVPLCFQHHHLIHDDHWRLTIDTERTLRWYRPDGTLERTTPLRPLLQRPTVRAAADDDLPSDTHAQGPPPDRGPPTTDQTRLFDADAA